MSEQSFALNLLLKQGYQFAVDFGREGGSGLLVDEPPPLGTGAGPNPARVLGAAVGSYLGASLVFCLRKARIQPTELRISVDGTLVRNERGRLRIGGLRVKLAPSSRADEVDRIGRCAELFEDYCIVTESVRNGMEVDVEVQPLAPVEVRQ